MGNNIFTLDFPWQNKAFYLLETQKEYEIILSLLFIISRHFISHYE